MATDTFQTRLSNIMGSEYNPSQRRSVQTAVLYEADRCLNSRYKSLRPFQRKIALYDCAVDLINSLTFIPPYHKLGEFISARTLFYCVVVRALIMQTDSSTHVCVTF